MPFLDTKHLREIKNIQELNLLDESLSWVIRYNSKPRQPLEITLFKLEEWLAVPVTNSDFSTPIFQKKLYKTLKSYQYFNLYALLLGENAFAGYSGDITLDSLCEFRGTISSFYSVLFSGVPEPNFAIVSIESEYYVVAGKADFIHQLFDREIQAYFSRFQDFTVDNFLAGFPGDIAASLEKKLTFIYNQLKDEYEKAEVGAEFHITP